MRMRLPLSLLLFALSAIAVAGPLFAAQAAAPLALEALAGEISGEVTLAQFRNRTPPSGNSWGRQQQRQNLFNQQRQRATQQRAMQQQRIVQRRQEVLQRQQQLAQFRVQQRQVLEQRRQLLKTQQAQLRDQQLLRQRADADRTAKDTSAAVNRRLTAVALLATAGGVTPHLQERLGKLSTRPAEPAPELKTDEQHRKDLRKEGKLGVAEPIVEASGTIHTRGGDSAKTLPKETETKLFNASPSASLPANVKARIQLLKPADTTPAQLSSIAHPVDLTAGRRAHILAYHRAGSGKAGRTEFPPSWNDERIIHHVSDVATDPASMRSRDSRGTPFATGFRDGMEIRVNFFPDGHPRAGQISTAYPINVAGNSQ